MHNRHPVVLAVSMANTEIGFNFVERESNTSQSYSKKTRLVEKNKPCRKRQDLLKIVVEKNDYCRKRQLLSKKQLLLKKTIIVVLDEPR